MRGGVAVFCTSFIQVWKEKIFVTTSIQFQFNCSLVWPKNASTSLSSIRHHPLQKLVHWTQWSLPVDCLSCNRLQHQSSCLLSICFLYCKVFVYAQIMSINKKLYSLGKKLQQLHYSNFAKLSVNSNQFQFRLRLALFPPWSSHPPTQPSRLVTRSLFK